MSADMLMPLLDGRVLDPMQPWPMPVDRRAMADESGFGQLDMHRYTALMEQTAAILREAKDKRHEAIRRTLMREVEA